jgi:ABC-type glycerol-3-phosphate transport system substrate-binding protein
VMTQDGLVTWMIVWLYAFGAELYADGDYSRVAINTPEAVAGLEYIKLLVDRGYAPPYPNEVNDDIGVEMFTTGKVFSCMLQTGHADYWVPEQVKNGVIPEAFGYTFIEFPHGPGVAHTPVSGYQVVVNARRTDNEARNLATIELFKTQVGVEYQTYTTTIQGAFPTLTGFDVPNIGTAAKPSYAAMQNVAASTGLMDLGGMHPRAKEVMAAWKIPMQEFMDGDITAQAVLDRFEAEANRILGE